VVLICIIVTRTGNLSTHVTTYITTPGAANFLGVFLTASISSVSSPLPSSTGHAPSWAVTTASETANSRHSKIPSDPQQQPRRPPATPPVGTGPQLNSQPPTFRPPQQTPKTPLRRAAAGYAISYPGPGPLNAPRTNPSHGMYLGYPGAPPP
jgi:hypothetical protein